MFYRCENPQSPRKLQNVKSTQKIQKPHFKFIAVIVLAALSLCVLANAALASVRRDDFLSQLLTARGFATQTNVQNNAAFILRTGLVTDQVGDLSAPVTRREALRWIIQALGLSTTANILSDVNFAAIGLNFNDAAALTPFERGSLIIAARVRPTIFENNTAAFGGDHNISQDEANALMATVRSAAQQMRFELRFSPAPGMDLEIFREGVFSAVPRWRVFVDGFDTRAEVDATRRFLAAQGFSTEANNPNFEWRLASELLDDYAQVRHLTSLAASQGRSTRILPSLRNTNLENQPFYWALLTIDPGAYLLEPIIAPGGVMTLAPLSLMVRTSGVSAAINAGFFGVAGRNRGAPIGTLLINNLLAHRPFQGRTNMGWSNNNRAAFGEVTWNGRILLYDGSSIAINSLNQHIRGNATVVYNIHFGSGRATPVQDDVVEVVVENGRSIEMRRGGGTTITPGRLVIAGYGAHAGALVRQVRVGQPIRLEGSFNNDDTHWNNMDNIIQAGPFLIRSRVIGIEPEGFNNSFINLRHPRSAIGLTENGRWFFFVGDGRDGMHSAGFTLPEIAAILRRRGAAYALNLDGGGSSQLMIGNRMFNSPSERRERPISYGVGVRRR